MTVKRWSKEDEKFLTSSYTRLNNSELADHFGVSKIAVQRKLARLKLIRQFQKQWNDTEERYLYENYHKMSDLELAGIFNVTPVAIRRKLARIGCYRNLKKKKRGLMRNLKNTARNKDDSLRRSDSETSDFSTFKTKTDASLINFFSQDKKPECYDKNNNINNAFTDTINSSRASHPPSADSKVSVAPVNIRKKTVKMNANDYSKMSSGGTHHRENDDIPCYNCAKSYSNGEIIYHKTWDDTGRVVKTIKTSGGNKAIIVDFKKMGEKILLSEVTGIEEV